MHHHSIVRLGAPILRSPAQSVNLQEFQSRELANVIQVMINTMEYNKGFGIAAPQVGIDKRIFIFGIQTHPGYPNLKPMPRTVVINPIMKNLSDETEVNYEGCLSVGDLRGKVKRYNHIHFKGYDFNGKLIEQELQGVHARMFQHEYDHLNGIIFIDRIKDIKSIGFHNELVSSGEIVVHKRENKRE